MSKLFFHVFHIVKTNSVRLRIRKHLEASRNIYFRITVRYGTIRYATLSREKGSVIEQTFFFCFFLLNYRMVRYTVLYATYGTIKMLKKSLARKTPFFSQYRTQFKLILCFRLMYIYITSRKHEKKFNREESLFPLKPYAI